MDLRALDPELAAGFLTDQEWETNHGDERPFPFAGRYHCQRQLHGISSPAKGLEGSPWKRIESVLSQNGDWLQPGKRNSRVRQAEGRCLCPSCDENRSEEHTSELQ